MRDFRMLIDGELTAGGARLDVLNPATEQPFAQAPRADLDLLNAAVAAANAAFGAWSMRDINDRRLALAAMADALEASADEMTRLLTSEQGKPLGEAAYEIGGSIAALRVFAGMELTPRTLRDSAAENVTLERAPLGVVAAITPWNFPVLLLILKLAPALLAGNTVVAKPAPTTPLTTLALGRLGQKLLPRGVLNFIVDNNDLGDALAGHSGVAKVSFTGSTTTGRRVMATAARTVKRLTLELGGNDAALILDDADVKAAAQRVFNAAMLNAGQVCLAAKRVYVPEKMYDDVCAALADLAESAVVGPGDDEGTQIGPVQNKAQYEKLVRLLRDAQTEGRVIAGGRTLDRAGYFIKPTIVRDLADSSELVREEQFGPMLPVLRYADLDEAVSRINDSAYGLGATIWTGDAARGRDVARRITAGTVWVNKHMDLPFDIPFGGAKQSGVGVESGQLGLEEYTQVKVINSAAHL